MSRTSCPRETEIARAAAAGVGAGAPSAEIQAHIQGCSSCREVFSVASSLRAFASAASAEPFVHAPGRVWWKAEIAKERATAREAMTPVRAVEIGGPVAAACVLAGWVAWRWGAVRPVLEGWLRSLPGGGAPSPATVVVTLAAAAVALAVTAVALRPFMARDRE